MIDCSPVAPVAICGNKTTTNRLPGIIDITSFFENSYWQLLCRLVLFWVDFETTCVDLWSMIRYQLWKKSYLQLARRPNILEFH